MLRRLEVRSFAVIEELALDLGPGLNAFTGETGAGKSILIEALGFLLGSRGSQTWLRAGADRLSVTGHFDAAAATKELKAQFKLAAAAPVVVRRELDASGRTRAWIGAQPAPLAALAAFGDRLVDFHGQHEHQTLLKPSVQLECLDAFAGLGAEREEAAAAFAAWEAARAELESSRLSDEERRRRVDLARWQLQEIEEAKPRPGEEEELEDSLPRIKNAERIKSLAASAYEALYEAEGSVLGGLLKAERALGELARVDESLRGSAERLAAARIALDEVAREVGLCRDLRTAGPEELDALLSRQDKLSRLKKKYGPTLEEVLSLRDRLTLEVARLENYKDRAESLQAELSRAEDALASVSAKLHGSRMKAARKLETALLKELRPLGLAQAAFSVSVELEEGRWTRAGSDAVEFLLAPNPGEPLKPVKSIASGGELSRVMLALKTVLARAEGVPILVFDEVDAGVGGVVGRAVGEKLARLGEARQILCVTHLPQVAGCARKHFHVAKAASGGRTFTTVETLAGARRLEVIATMLGGREATAASRKHAQELLEESLA